MWKMGGRQALQMTESWKNFEEPLAVVRSVPRALHVTNYWQSRLYSSTLMPWYFKIGPVNTVLSQSKPCCSPDHVTPTMAVREFLALFQEIFYLAFSA